MSRLDQILALVAARTRSVCGPRARRRGVRSYSLSGDFRHGRGGATACAGQRYLAIHLDSLATAVRVRAVRDARRAVCCPPPHPVCVPVADLLAAGHVCSKRQAVYISACTARCQPFLRLTTRRARGSCARAGARPTRARRRSVPAPLALAGQERERAVLLPLLVIPENALRAVDRRRPLLRWDRHSMRRPEESW